MTNIERRNAIYDAIAEMDRAHAAEDTPDREASERAEQEFFAAAKIFVSECAKGEVKFLVGANNAEDIRGEAEWLQDLNEARKQGDLIAFWDPKEIELAAAETAWALK